MKRALFVVLLAAALAFGLVLGIAVSDTRAAQTEGPELAAQTSDAAAACAAVPLTISFCAPYGTSNPPINQMTLRLTDNSTGANRDTLIPVGATSVTIPNVQTGRSYTIRIGFVPPPGTPTTPMRPYGLYYWLNGWNGTAGGQLLEAWTPGINQYVSLPCQSAIAARPVYVTVKPPPTGVIAGYLGVWANGTAPAYTVNNAGSLGPHYEWRQLPGTTALGVTVELWLPPTQKNPWGTLVTSTVTNAEGYFQFTKLDPCLAYELKFTWNDATRIAWPIVPTYQGQVYQINAPNAGIFQMGGAFLPSRW